MVHKLIKLICVTNAVLSVGVLIVGIVVIGILDILLVLLLGCNNAVCLGKSVDRNDRLNVRLCLTLNSCNSLVVILNGLDIRANCCNKELLERALILSIVSYLVGGIKVIVVELVLIILNL